MDGQKMDRQTMDGKRTTCLSLCLQAAEGSARCLIFTTCHINNLIILAQRSVATATGQGDAAVRS